MGSLQSQIRWCGKAQWCLGGFMAALVVAFLVIAYMPMNRSLQSLEEQIRSADTEIADRATRNSALDELKKENDRLQSKLNRMKELPLHQDLPQFLGDLTQLGRQSMIRNVKNQPGMTQRTSQFSAMPITLKFDGDFLSVCGFLRDLEQLKRLTRVRSLTVETSDSKSGEVRAELAVNLYWAE